MKRLVFVIDDEPAIRRYLEAALTLLSYRVAVFPSVEEALAAAPSERPDLALVDWMMPVPLDAGAIAALRAAGCARVVVCSAHVIQGEVDRILAAGPDAFLPKPCTLEDLERGLRRWLE